LLLRQYLALIRLPNVFTAPTNVLTGYFSSVALEDASGTHLVALMVSSSLLYVAGIVLNDYFDLEVDKKERPSRPLASGVIKKEHAMVLALAALTAANTICILAVGLASFAISVALSGAILAYNYRLKRKDIAGPLTMGTARFLNVILGASPGLGAIIIASNATMPQSLWTVVLAATSLFAYVIAIMILSKRETIGSGRQVHVQAFSIVLALILAIGILGFALQFHLTFLINLMIFAAAMIFTFRLYLNAVTPAEFIQKAIRNMIVSIVILDSVFVSGTVGLTFGMATLLFIIPAVVLARRMYVT
jgi:4-hydroxybenzoate polyprenyltransferase